MLLSKTCNVSRIISIRHCKMAKSARLRVLPYIKDMSLDSHHQASTIVILKNPRHYYTTRITQLLDLLSGDNRLVF